MVPTRDEAFTAAERWLELQRHLDNLRAQADAVRQAANDEAVVLNNWASKQVGYGKTAYIHMAGGIIKVRASTYSKPPQDIERLPLFSLEDA